VNPEISKFDWPDALALGPVTVLTGLDKGKYPHGNSLIVTGDDEVVLIDPSLTVAERGVPVEVNKIFLSHVHEDHIPGMQQLPELPVFCHEEDAVGLSSLDGLMSMYGLPDLVEKNFRREVVNDFHYSPRTNVSTFTDGSSFDLGGVQIQVIHTPGHTKGHSAFLIPEARTAYLGDIELSGFGPYYFDACSSLDSFEWSLDRCSDLEADHFVTFHHKWVISGRDRFLAMLNEFANVITKRELALLRFLKEPRSISDCVAHRFVYRPSVDMQFVDHVETSCAKLHIARMVKDGRVTEVTNGKYRAT
tara:strand:- start:3312 stop:4226 length:915 start_codon:yes stop_codon:yes gene_type:complete